jgi:hypothetical protein
MLIQLTWQVSKNNGCNVRVVNELVNQSDTCVVDDHNSVAALICDLNGG